MILVTGATGNIGSYLVNVLVAKAAGMQAWGVEIVVGSFDRPETLDAAMRGVERVFLFSPSAPDQVALQSNVVAAAKRAGVRRIVKLFGAGAGLENPGVFARWHGEIEAHICSACADGRRASLAHRAVIGR